MPSAVSAEKVGAGATERPWRVGTYPGDDDITVRDGADMWVCRTIRPSQAAAIVAAVNSYHPERDAYRRGFQRAIQAAADLAHDRMILCKETAKDIAQRFPDNPNAAASERCAGYEARHISEEILKLKPTGEEQSLAGNMTEAQIKHMVDRFLCWRLPESFKPDGGISFKKTFNEHTAHPMKHEPVGTNLFDATQADAMVRHMIDGLPAPHPERDALLVEVDGSKASPEYLFEKAARNWAVEKWRSEVANRPLQNIYRDTLDITWRQVIRHFGGDDEVLCGPRHTELVEAARLRATQAEPSA